MPVWNPEIVEPNNASRASYAVNTNLEQISDWLTKIIVGVGLVQIGTVIEQFKALASYFGEGFKSGSTAAAAPVVAAAIIIYGLTAGFLAGYLLTRMFLPGAFNRADRAIRAVRVLRRQIVEEREMTEEAGRLQGKIYTDLYRFEDQGFREAIAKLEELLKSPANMRNLGALDLFGCSSRSSVSVGTRQLKRSCPCEGRLAC